MLLARGLLLHANNMGVSCPYCSQQNATSDSRELITSSGSFLRKSDQTRHQRFRCKPCRKTFSTATSHPCYRQKKRHINPLLFQLLVSGVSQRRLAILLRVNRKTIIRKFLFLGFMAQHFLYDDLHRHPPAIEVEFDDLETFEHSKLKPLSVISLVESGTRRFLGFKVARMPAKGLLVARSLKKYGKRADERKTKRRELFHELQNYIHANAIIKSDESPHYPQDVKEFFPKAIHKTYKGRRGCVVGQGELKSGGFDPIFSLNHSYAMTRANANRLFRRTWNTTKRPDRLSLHFAMYVLFHNLYLIHHPAR